MTLTRKWVQLVRRHTMVDDVLDVEQVAPDFAHFVAVREVKKKSELDFVSHQISEFQADDLLRRTHTQKPPLKAIDR